MAKIHYFQRYSSKENTVTNNTLLLLARIYDYSTSRASAFLSEITGEPIEIGIEINQQKRAKRSVPDGTVIQRGFKVVIESKVDSGVDGDQIARHAEGFSNESAKVLLLLTKNSVDQATIEDIKRRIAEKQPGVIFKNTTYEEICRIIEGMFKEWESEMSSIAEDYIDYCGEVDLIDRSRYLLRISPCGGSMGINKKHGIYFHPSDRGYTEHAFVGVYKNKSVQAIWKIDSVYDATLENGKLEKILVQGRDTDKYDGKIMAIIQDAEKECGYDIKSGHRFFCGEPHETDYRKSSPRGIQGARFKNLSDVIDNLDLEDVEDIASKLRKETWE